MADEIDLDNLDKQMTEESKVEKRIRDLSEKVKLTSEERDTLRKELEEQQKKVADLEKEGGFLSSFGEQVTKYPDAVTFRDKIKERVMRGYSVEDATVAVLNAEGKLSAPKQAAPAAPVGGSAINVQPSVGDKKVGEMTREEKRAALIEAEKRGDLGTN